MGHLSLKEEYEKACDAYDERWKPLDDLMYRFFREHPGHSEIGQAYAKVVLVDRVYAAGLARLLRCGGTTDAIAMKIAKNAAKFDSAVGELPRCDSPLDEDRLGIVVKEHAAFIRLLKETGLVDKDARSFASKYLHFHCPVVPLYDNRVAKNIARNPFKAWLACNPTRPEWQGDREYAGYCWKFLGLLRKLKEEGVETPDVRRLDALVWGIPSDTEDVDTRPRRGNMRTRKEATP
jgi:hypothetical protein